MTIITKTSAYFSTTGTIGKQNTAGGKLKSDKGNTLDSISQTEKNKSDC